MNCVGFTQAKFLVINVHQTLTTFIVCYLVMAGMCLCEKIPMCTLQVGLIKVNLCSYQKQTAPVFV